MNVHWMHQDISSTSKILPEVLSTNHQILPLPALTIAITLSIQLSLFRHTNRQESTQKHNTPDSTQESWCRITACSICSEVRPNFSSTWTFHESGQMMKQSRFCWQKSPPKREKKGVGLLVCYCFNPPPKKKNGLVYIRCNTWCYHLMCIWKCWQLKTVFLHPTSRLEVFHGLVLFCFSFFHKAKKAKNEQNKKMKYVEKKSRW